MLDRTTKLLVPGFLAISLLAACSEKKGTVVTASPPVAASPPVKTDSKREQASLYVSYGDKYVQEKQYEGARTFYNRALDLYPSDEIRAKLSSIAKHEDADAAAERAASEAKRAGRTSYAGSSS